MLSGALNRVQCHYREEGGPKVAGKWKKTGAPNMLPKEKGELSRGHRGERHWTERQGLGHHRLRDCAKDLGNYPIGRGNHEGALGEGVTRLNIYFRNPTLSAIHTFVP